MRDWPNFFIIGAAKSGTTALYSFLREHPQIFFGPVKEPCYWAFGEWRPGYAGPGDTRLLGVRDREDYRRLYSGVGQHMAVGDASVIYLYSRRAARRIWEARPDARLIVLLRQPAERAFSHYLMKLRSGDEVLQDFGAALAAEPERMKRNWHPSWYYRDRGYYDRQLAVWAEWFSRERFCILLHDELQREPLRIVQRVFRFLGVDEGFVPDVSTRYNEGGRRPRSSSLWRFVQSNRLRPLARRLMPAGSYERFRSLVHERLQTRAQLPAEQWASLTAGYREDILRLQDRVGQDLSVWLKDGRH